MDDDLISRAELLDNIDDLKDEMPYNYAPFNDVRIRALEEVEDIIKEGTDEF